MNVTAISNAFLKRHSYFWSCSGLTTALYLCVRGRSHLVYHSVHHHLYNKDHYNIYNILELTTIHLNTAYSGMSVNNTNIRNIVVLVIAVSMHKLRYYLVV